MLFVYDRGWLADLIARRRPGAMGGKEGPHDHTPSAIAQTTARPKSRNHEDLLRTLLEREARLCPPTHQPGQPVPKAHPDAVGASERDLEAAWIVSSARRLHLDGDVSGLAIAILDRLIQNTTVFVRYVNCAAVAALFIACKLLEDSGLGADAGEFLSRLHLRGRYSPAELKRMEISILTHLDWDVMLPSAERFLSLLLSSIGGTSVSSAVRARLEVVLTQSRVSWAFRPSTLALAVLSHLLEAQTPLTWLNTTHAFLRRLEIDGSDLIVCREMVSEVWAICEQQQRTIAAIMGAGKRVTRRKKRTSSHASSGWKMGGAPLVQRMNSAQLMGLCPEAKRSKSPWSVCEEENTESCDLAEALKILYQQS